jgi:hypothetical protein
VLAGAGPLVGRMLRRGAARGLPLPWRQVAAFAAFGSVLPVPWWGRLAHASPTLGSGMATGPITHMLYIMLEQAVDARASRGAAGRPGG